MAISTHDKSILKAISHSPVLLNGPNKARFKGGGYMHAYKTERKTQSVAIFFLPPQNLMKQPKASFNGKKRFSNTARFKEMHAWATTT